MKDLSPLPAKVAGISFYSPFLHFIEKMLHSYTRRPISLTDCRLPDVDSLKCYIMLHIPT